MMAQVQLQDDERRRYEALKAEKLRRLTSGEATTITMHDPVPGLEDDEPPQTAANRPEPPQAESPPTLSKTAEILLAAAKRLTEDRVRPLTNDELRIATGLGAHSIRRARCELQEAGLWLEGWMQPARRLREEALMRGEPGMPPWKVVVAAAERLAPGGGRNVSQAELQVATGLGRDTIRQAIRFAHEQGAWHAGWSRYPLDDPDSPRLEPQRKPKADPSADWKCPQCGTKYGSTRRCYVCTPTVMQRISAGEIVTRQGRERERERTPAATKTRAIALYEVVLELLRALPDDPSLAAEAVTEVYMRLEGTASRERS